MTVCRVEADLPVPARRELQVALGALRAEKERKTSTIVIDDVPMHVPRSVRAAVTALLEHLSEGRGVAIAPVDTLVTTSAAADLLGLSRTYVCRLVDDGTLAAEYRGTHRRIPLQTVLDYREQRRHDRAQALDDVSSISREAGLYDDDF
ncbi:excisionase family DNA-binding protein [Nocardia inohanensis]|uniref:excisionase family DNA-binding protein n=1 Tax=Nocardia inohanensis TaxID=209246 RepID=UPI000836F88C|nr:excisionase family DNA-binding protein [Nocardia inohanensis]